MIRQGLLLFPILLISGYAASQVTIDYPRKTRGIEIAVSRIREALEGTGYHTFEVTKRSGAPRMISLSILQQGTDIKSEGYRIERKGHRINVLASDPSGLRYGSLALADQLMMGTSLDSIHDEHVDPTFAVRAIKFNLPWEPYRESKSMNHHLSTCRDLSFWKSFLNMMMDNRFNLLALYNMHPFPYMIRLKDYPEASPFRKREMEEWKAFWRELFKMAKDRGIDVFIVNWNIVVPEAFAEKHHVRMLNDTSAVVMDYTRKSVEALINEYEDLGGIGVTLADWMENMTPAQREDWIDRTFIAGMNSARRKTRFLHRAVLSGSSDEMRRIIDKAALPDPVLVEVKFNWSHGHSTPDLLITHASSSGQVNTGFWEPEPKNYKIEWMIRNEDFFILRWGEPGFIREHIRKNNKPYVNGYYIGSEGYIPAYEYFTKSDIGRTWQYAYERQWLFYSLWGRLLYDESTPDLVFEEQFNRKYRLDNGKQMLRAFTLASRMPLRLASFYSGTWDYTLYAEGFMAPVIPNGYGYDDHRSLFISIDELIDHKVLDPRYVPIKTFAELKHSGKTISQNQLSPLDLAKELETDADTVSALLTKLRRDTTRFSAEYNQELDDLQVWTLLSNYFSYKLKAGVALQMHRLGGEPSERESAIRWLEKCHGYWMKIAEVTDRNYEEVAYFRENPQKDSDSDYFSWRKYLKETQHDIDIARTSAQNR